MNDHVGKVALVTGSSRGVGAETVRGLVNQGISAVISYRDKAARAETLADELRVRGGSVLTTRADLTVPEAVESMIDTVAQRFGRLDFLILNASGGMERDVDAGYAMALNRDAQVYLAESAQRLMSAGGRIVYVTSHQSHFYGRRAVPDAYRPVAESKLAGELALRDRIPALDQSGIQLAGELALRDRIPALDQSGIRLTVVSGDMITDTITVKMLERAQPGTIAAREAGAGTLLTVKGFAEAIVSAALDEHTPTGHTEYVGGSDYLA